MFEEEASEYSERTKTEKEIEVLNTVHDWGPESLSPDERRLFGGIQDRKRAREQGFRDGAEFGYSKGYRDAEEHYLNVIDSQHKLVDASTKDYFKGSYNKADVWHYHGVPHDNKPYLCKVEQPTKFDESEYEILFFDYKETSWYRWLTLWSGEEGTERARINRKVIAWKEIG